MNLTAEMDIVKNATETPPDINYWPMQRVAAGVFVALWGMVMIVPCLLFIRYTYQQLVELFHTYSAKHSTKETMSEHEKEQSLLSESRISSTNQICENLSTQNQNHHDP